MRNKLGLSIEAVPNEVSKPARFLPESGLPLIMKRHLPIIAWSKAKLA